MPVPRSQSVALPSGLHGIERRELVLHPLPRRLRVPVCPRDTKGMPGRYVCPRRRGELLRAKLHRMEGRRNFVDEHPAGVLREGNLLRGVPDRVHPVPTRVILPAGGLRRAASLPRWFLLRGQPGRVHLVPAGEFLPLRSRTLGALLPCGDFLQGERERMHTVPCGNKMPQD